MAIIQFENGVKVEFKGNPTKADVEEVQKKLAAQGAFKNTISPQNTAQAQESSPFLKQVGDFVGVSKLGQALASTYRTLTGETAKDQQAVNNITSENSKLMAYAKTLPAGERRTRLLKMAGTGETDITKIDPGLALTNKEILGSAGNAALTIASFGSLPGAGAVTGALSKGVSVADKLASTGVFQALGRGAGLAARTAEGLATGYASDVANNATNNQDNILAPGAGTVVGGIAPSLITGAGKLIKGSASLLSGVSTDVINQAIKNPEAISNSVKAFAKSPETKQTLVDTAKTAINGFLKARSEEFGKAISSMTSKQPLSKQVVVNEFAKQIDNFGGKIKNGQLVFGDTALTKGDVNNLKQAWAAISKWKDVTPSGFDTLRQSLGNYMNDFKAAGNPRANVILGSVKQALTSHMNENIDGYSNILSSYGKKTVMAKQILKELGLEGKKDSTKLSNVLKLFHKDPKVVESIKKIMGNEAEPFLNDLSGAILSEWLPVGKFGNVIRGAVQAGGAVGAKVLGASMPAIATGIGAGLAASSPRIVGKTARLVGKGINKGVNTGIRRGIGNIASKLN